MAERFATVTELHRVPKATEVGTMPGDGSGLVVVPNFPSWDAQAARNRLTNVNLPSTGTEDWQDEPPSRPDLTLIKGQKKDPPKFSPNSRAALLAAARRESTPTVSSHQIPLEDGGGVSHHTTLVDRITRHSSPVTAVKVQSESVTPQRALKVASWGRAPEIAHEDGLRHSRMVSEAKQVLGDPDPVVRTLAMLAADEALRAGSKQYLENPRGAIDVYVAGHPGITDSVAAKLEELERKRSDRIPTSRPSHSVVRDRRNARLEKVGLK